MPVKQDRDIKNGQYALEDMNAMCKCGHPLGVHSAARSAKDKSQPCYVHDLAGGEHCDCEFFTRVRRKK